MSWRSFVGDRGRSSASSTSAPARPPRSSTGVRAHGRGRRRRGARQPRQTPPEVRHDQPRDRRPRPTTGSPSGSTTSSRARLAGGTLAAMVADGAVVGVTTNPSIFEKALAHGEAYADQVRDLAAARSPSRRRSVRSPPTTCAAPATSCARPTTRAAASTAGCRSRSTRAWPTTPATTIAEAARLWWLVDRPNLLIKIPATLAGLPAITRSLSRGDQRQRHADLRLDRYREVMDAYLARAGAGEAPTGTTCRTIHSVASLLRRPGSTPRSTRGWASRRRGRRRLRGQAAIANARLAWAAYEEVFASDRWKALAAAARTRSARCGPRPASRTRLRRHPLRRRAVAPGTVNTMPEATLDAVADHGRRPRRHVHRDRAAPRRRRSTLSPRSGSTSTTSSRCSRSRASRSSRTPGSRSLATVRDQLAAAAPKQA